MRILTSLSVIALLLSVGCTPRHYTATAVIELLRADPDSRSLEANQLAMTGSRTETEIAVIESSTILKGVIKQLKSSNQANSFISPYEEEATAENLANILKKYRSVEVTEPGLRLNVSYAHPDPEIAALVANTFAKEYIDYTLKLYIDNSMKAVEDLRIRADQQKERVEEIELILAENNFAAEYKKPLERDLEVQKTFHKALIDRMTQERAIIGGRSSARIVDLATPPTK